MSDAGPPGLAVADVQRRDAHQRARNAELGWALRRIRRAQRLSIEELALAAGMHPTYLSGIERGVRNPTWGKLSSLAAALDLPVSVIARDAETIARRISDMRLGDMPWELLSSIEAACKRSP
jgi:transcriptional regulator with XRE-family HTH domain